MCCVCNRMLFSYQVLHCKKEDYNKSAAMAGLAEKCISDKYLHKCCADCVLPCVLMDTPRGQLWICYTCHSKINKGVLPPECAMNSMVVEPIPAELACLNSFRATFNCSTYSIHENVGITERGAKWSPWSCNVCSIKYCANEQFVATF